MAPYHELLEVKWKTGDQDKFKFTSNAPITSDSGGVKIGLGDVTEPSCQSGTNCPTRADQFCPALSLGC
ncbi:hypothetical protein PCASD_19480 [Puccinia coronata f. sp. avenae]|uniref:Uncharacterized protein n=1 Tax=Puccinia coronata f. sp. avenae TaxID=200324 RepID=A0A2N5TIX7_9BASI|nr:hypothetical protein PCASD_24736 [Puccinia coronata f. sp. avenae]PLW34709.1 hypothetical protein PCASD_19480 [Puccinia coronata f. sp. avenae]